MIELAVGAVVGGLVTLAVRLSAEVHRRRVERMHYFRSKFFASADRVLDEDNVEDAQLVALTEMAQNIASRKSFSALLWAVINLERKLRVAGIAPVHAKYPDEWYPVLVNYFMAVSYLRGIQGIYLRSLLAELFDSSSGYRNVEIIDRRIRSGRLQAV